MFLYFQDINVDFFDPIRVKVLIQCLPDQHYPRVRLTFHIPLIQDSHHRDVPRRGRATVPRDAADRRHSDGVGGQQQRAGEAAATVRLRAARGSAAGQCLIWNLQLNGIFNH